MQAEQHQAGYCFLWISPLIAEEHLPHIFERDNKTQIQLQCGNMINNADTEDSTENDSYPSWNLTTKVSGEYADGRDQPWSFHK